MRRRDLESHLFGKDGGPRTLWSNGARILRSICVGCIPQQGSLSTSLLTIFHSLAHKNFFSLLFCLFIFKNILKNELSLWSKYWVYFEKIKLEWACLVVSSLRVLPLFKSLFILHMDQKVPGSYLPAKPRSEVFLLMRDLTWAKKRHFKDRSRGVA